MAAASLRLADGLPGVQVLSVGDTEDGTKGKGAKMKLRYLIPVSLLSIVLMFLVVAAILGW